MNMLSLVVIILLIFLTLKGYRKGLVQSVLSAFSLVITLFLVSYLSPTVTEFIEVNTPLHGIIAEQCEKSFSINMDSVSAMNKNGTISEIHEAMIDQLELPNIFKEGLKKHNNVKSYQELGVKNFNEYIPKYIADMILKALVFVITWIIAAVALYFIMKAVDVISLIPGVHGVNSLLGAAFGFIKGICIVWIGFLLITMIGSSGVGSSLLAMIAESPFLEFLYDTNLALRLIQTLGSYLM